MAGEKSEQIKADGRILELGMDERDKGIIKTGVVGIVVNVLLSAFKAAVGLLSNSIAIVLDAVNNISDAASSLITIVGTKLAGKRPDRKHPYGYGRVEYLTTIIVAVIVLWAGVTSLQESVGRIINPEEASYDAVTLIIVAVAVVTKIVLGLYTKRNGQKLNSGSLVASGTDAPHGLDYLGGDAARGVHLHLHGRESRGVAWRDYLARHHQSGYRHAARGSL